VRRVDGLGHDVLLIPDHLGLWPPLSPLVAAAYVSDRLRFGVQVLNNEFWNPVLLAREVEAVDVLTSGRLELGFGAGHGRRGVRDGRHTPTTRRVPASTGWPSAVPRVRELLSSREHIPFMVGGKRRPGAWPWPRPRPTSWA
jgi:alkanesulfonate monooxygenase SsuD/methylene tetrahydromethanopterin reductase-like flavin-dependent oxidoreductase (luciferase family)